MIDHTERQPKISVVVLNYNGIQWIPRCFESLHAQTIFPEIEIILTDNKSSDGSDQYGAEWLARENKGKVVQNGVNLGYCEANNNGAAAATGKYLLFLNNDTWLEPDCLEKLFAEVELVAADAATPLVLDYDDNTFQNIGASGLDLFGFTTHLKPLTQTGEVFTACGCSYLIRADIFKKVGGFDPTLFIYADETCLSWRVWIAGGKVVGVPAARLHHRGAAVVNPKGKTKMVESRTTDRKRYLANRNGILFLLKNAQHLLLLLVAPHLLLMAVEGMAGWIVLRRWSFFRDAYLKAIIDCWRMRGHVREWRRHVRSFRQQSDFWMLRFLRLKPSRWAEVERLFKMGVPKVDRR